MINNACEIITIVDKCLYSTVVVCKGNADENIQTGQWLECGKTLKKELIAKHYKLKTNNCVKTTQGKETEM